MKYNIPAKSFLLALSILLSLSDCRKKEDHQIFKNSWRTDIDFYLIPEKFNVMETDWVNTKGQAHFNKQDLIRHLKSYGRTLNDLQKMPELEFTENEDTITLTVAKTSHSTHYSYDINIPISFYGPKWFLKGEYSDIVHQQNIVPTLAKLLKIRNPNGVETKAITKILKDQTPSEKPEIIVTVVIDQGGQQYYKAHPGVPKNILKIRESSSYFPNAKVGHVDSQTAVGHMAIGTGSYPRKSGIIGNTKFFMKDGKMNYTNVYSNTASDMNTEELEVETLSDVLDHENSNQSEILSQCYAHRASIGMAGHGSYPIKNATYNGDKDMVYWIDKTNGSWVTDNRFYTLPKSVSSFNSYENYKTENPSGPEGKGLPPNEELKNYFYEIMSTSAEVKMEGEMFRKVLKEQIIDTPKAKDGITDLAYVTFKATDAAGHTYGWESLEAKEAFRETDNQIGLLFELLQKEYGDSFILIITADHGCAPLPEISGGQRLVVDEVFKEVNSLLPAGAEDDLIRFLTVGQISLNHGSLKTHNISEKQVKDKILGIRVNGRPFFKQVLSANDIKH